MSTSESRPSVKELAKQYVSKRVASLGRDAVHLEWAERERRRAAKRQWYKEVNRDYCLRPGGADPGLVMSAVRCFRKGNQ